MIVLTRGNLIEGDAEALVNTVNCHGFMGKGIALQFKHAHDRERLRAASECPGHPLRTDRRSRGQGDARMNEAPQADPRSEANRLVTERHP